MAKKYVYAFGPGKADGTAAMKNLLGGKGANLAEMCNLGLPVPAGFTITTDCCTDYFANKMKFPAELMDQVEKALKAVEKTMGMKFGDAKNPLLVSCRSGARMSMPGMMETVLNVGLCLKTIPGLVEKTKNERFVYDSYRRLMMMYSDVVMEKAEGIEPKEKGIRLQLEEIMDELKHRKGYKQDTDMTVADLKELCEKFKARIKASLGKSFPDDPMDQLKGGIGAVFKSWNGRRAIAYRNIEGIPHEWGTATNVQAMVFGNMGNSSATGVAFTRNPANGERKFFGEYLVNAQGEDVVAGIRTPEPINEATKSEHTAHLVSLEKKMPEAYKKLDDIQKKLEKHYKNMQDLEFTIQEGKLWMLQTRDGKRTGLAALNMAMDMLEERLIDVETALQRVKPAQLDELLHPVIDPVAEKQATLLGKGLPAGPGGAFGSIVFSAHDAVDWVKNGKAKNVILVREETNPEDIEGMRAADGILTARGGMTSHAALVARGWGKCCIVGASDFHINAATKTLTVKGKTLREGDVVTLNGTKGCVYEKRLAMIDATENPRFQSFLKLADKYKAMKVRANADTPADAKIARSFGAEGIGLFRTEHMFYGEGSDEPLGYLRQMILSKTVQERRAALDKLFPFVKRDLKATMQAMAGFPVTIRLLDPPLHEFVPHSSDKQNDLARKLNISIEDVKKRGEELQEVNPMLGHRGVRLGITYPELTEMQVRAILEAAAELQKEGVKVTPEIMIPVTCNPNELKDQKAIVNKVVVDVKAKYGLKNFEYLYGTMIEIPRAALLANEMAGEAEFFSFGTNDLTQMGFGFSRDDMGSFVGPYLDKKVLPEDPFLSSDQSGIGQLVQYGVERGRSVKSNLKIGVCGEHGGDPASVEFFYGLGLNYVSCSPFRVPIARLAAAQAEIKAKSKAKSGGGKSKKSSSSSKKSAPAKKAAKKAEKKAAKPAAKKSPAKKPSKKKK
ncbi:MAG: pyruvate, phosphate dikinase [Chitinispirillales bacterium]|jgi:pyruvate,orthophosphate dikinase|nr:pyruvate, phosphate dikinase [Chitinispirillales bacterium]